MTVRAFAVGVLLLALIAAGTSALGTAGRFPGSGPAAVAAAAPPGAAPVDLGAVIGPLDRPHRGYPALDLGLPAGAPVRSLLAGTAEVVSNSRCGNGIRVVGAQGAALFCHGQRVLVRSGEQVEAGQHVMDAGATGRTDPPGYVHLHIELRAPADSRDAARCPQPLVAALAAGRPAPALSALPTGGCVS